MLGAIAGDTIGSIYEWHNIKTKDFPIFKSKGKFRDEMFFTDDSICTIAVAHAIVTARKTGSDLHETMKRSLYELCNKYPHADYGCGYRHWLSLPYEQAKPYNSFGNGAVMRISPAGFLATSEEEAERFAIAACAPTHNHPDAVRWAVIVAKMIYWLCHGMTKDELMAKMKPMKELHFTLDEIRPTYRFNETTQGTAPQAIVAFFESTDFEDAIRNSNSIGGDSDTLAAVTGGLAEAAYGLPDDFKDAVLAKFKEDHQGAVLAALKEVLPDLPV